MNELPSEEPLDNRIDGAQWAYAVYGLAARAAGGALGLIRWAGNTVDWAVKPARGLLGIEALTPLYSEIDRLAQRGEQAVQMLAAAGKAEAERTRRQVGKVSGAVAGPVIAGLAESPDVHRVIEGQIELLLQNLSAQERVDLLVRALAANYLAYLQDHPEQVESLVRLQADQYIDHLSENPEQVQALVQGQSVGLVSNVSEEVRLRLVAADNVAEILMRKVLRRSPRELAAGPLSTPALQIPGQAAVQSELGNERD